ncbi:MAG: trypsin-like serine protease [Pseudomonadota bacterium]
MALLPLLSALILAPAALALPIINGTTTTDYKPVGAIGVLAGGGVYGPFCSATLISPTWVLTAGHCVDALNRDYAGYQGVFMIGDDLTRGYDEYTLILEAFAHPDYSSSNLAYDIGLLHLVGSGITSAGIMPVNRETIGQTWIGKDLRYVGFGVTDRYGGSQGAGVKRYADIPVWEYDRNYVYGYDPDDGQNVCSGDSGGAALEIVAEGQYEIVAVNSTVFAPYGGESCRDGATAGVRVDMNLDWIEQYADVFTAAEYYPDDPDPVDSGPFEDSAWVSTLPERPRDKAVDDWGCGCASGRPGLGGLLAGALGLLGLARRRRA